MIVPDTQGSLAFTCLCISHTDARTHVYTHTDTHTPKVDGVERESLMKKVLSFDLGAIRFLSCWRCGARIKVLAQLLELSSHISRPSESVCY